MVEVVLSPNSKLGLFIPSGELIPTKACVNKKTKSDKGSGQVAGRGRMWSSFVLVVGVEKLEKKAVHPSLSSRGRGTSTGRSVASAPTSSTSLINFFRLGPTPPPVLSYLLPQLSVLVCTPPPPLPPATATKTRNGRTGGRSESPILNRSSYGRTKRQSQTTKVPPRLYPSRPDRPPIPSTLKSGCERKEPSPPKPPTLIIRSPLKRDGVPRQVPRWCNQRIPACLLSRPTPHVLLRHPG